MVSEVEQVLGEVAWVFTQGPQVVFGRRCLCGKQGNDTSQVKPGGRSVGRLGGHQGQRFEAVSLALGLEVWLWLNWVLGARHLILRDVRQDLLAAVDKKGHEPLLHLQD